MRRIRKCGVIFLSFFLLQAISRAEGPDASPRFLVHLLDYLAKDYAGAVANGKILVQSEYDEQKEFIQSAVETNAKLMLTRDVPGIKAELSELQKMIADKADPDPVSKLARKIQAEVTEMAHLEVAPTQWPNLKHGKELYAQNCINCHGVKGAGDGLVGADLNPKPANFLDTEKMKELSPFHAFNVIRLGVPGTGMAPWPALTDQETWDLAFFVLSLHHQPQISAHKAGADLLGADTLKKVSVSSDEQLEALIPGDKKARETLLVALRTRSDDANQNGSLAIARAGLEGAAKDYAANDFDAAKTKALKAYLEGIEPIEPRLKATEPSTVAQLEEKMSAVRAAIEARKPVSELGVAIGSAQQQINEAEKLLQTKESSPWLTFSVSAGILLREGFEAVLIILALLGVLRAAKAKRAALWVHAGWILALGCGVAAWTFSGWLMNISGAQREMMEFVTSAFAVVVLLFLGFWLHSKTEIGRWTAFIDGRVKTALDGNRLIGLAFISFFAVFREAFETVLFLRAVSLEDAQGGGTTAMAAGVGSALLLIFMLSWLFMRYSVQLPIRKLFALSSVVMGVLAVILTGKGLHSLQETGFLSVTAFPVHVRWEVFGFFPTVETLGAQIFIFGLVSVLWFYGQKPSRELQLDLET